MRSARSSSTASRPVLRSRSPDGGKLFAERAGAKGVGAPTIRAPAIPWRISERAERCAARRRRRRLLVRTRLILACFFGGGLARTRDTGNTSGTGFREGVLFGFAGRFLFG